MLLGNAVARHGAPRVLFVKARIDDHHGEASAPAQGPMMLGAIARRMGWEARCVDTYLEASPEDALREALAQFAPHVIGLSALTAEHRSMHRLAKLARELCPDAVILAGGAHASADPEETVNDLAIDAAVLGEGERTLEEILDRVERGLPWRDVDGLALRSDDGSVTRTAPRAAIEDLDSLPLPAFDLTDIDAYARRRGMSLAGMRRYMPITTSRGCPYRCSYCHDIQGKRFRSHSPQYVLRMIDELRSRHDVHHYDVTDDIFNFDPERMLAICDGLIARGPGLGFTCPNGIRADRMTVAQAERMADAGCEYVAIAIETASKRLQKQIKKHLRFDKVLPIVEAFTRRNVFTSGFFMVGFPSETEAELQGTIDFALASKLHAAYFFVVTPFAGTGMHEEVVSAFGMQAAQLVGSGFFFRPRVNLSELSDARLYALRRNAYLRFYLDPRRVVRILRAHPRKADLAQYFATMLVRDALRIEPGKLLRPLAAFGARGRRRTREVEAPHAPSAGTSAGGRVGTVGERVGAARRKLPLVSNALDGSGPLG
jgi:anaerobic magnesium-protoporphyrin IX monomethyl ester cyclase